MEDKTIITMFAMATIMVLDLAAMVVLHIDGVLLTTCIGVIGGLAGYELQRMKNKK